MTACGWLLAVAFNVHQIFAALNEAQLDYSKWGGLAVILHGSLRATPHLDHSVGLSPGNASRGIRALALALHCLESAVPAGNRACT